MAYQQVRTQIGTKTSGSYTYKFYLYLYEDFDDPTNNPPYAYLSSANVSAATADLLENKTATWSLTVDGTTKSGSFSSYVYQSTLDGLYYRMAILGSDADRTFPITVAQGESFTAFGYGYIQNGAGAGPSGRIYLPKKVTITPPATVATDALNAFSCTPFTPPNVSGIEVIGYAKIIGSDSNIRNLYRTASTKLSAVKGIQISTFYWYPAHNDVDASAFSGGVASYELTLNVYWSSSTTDWGNSQVCIFEGTTGSINYNDTPPPELAPSCSITVQEVGGIGLLAQYGKYIQGKSSVRFTVGKSFKYGATQASKSFYVGGNYVSGEVTTITMQADGTATLSITDDHGNTTQTSVSYEVYSYWNPTFAELSVRRCRQDGTPDDTGAYCKITYEVSIAPIGNQNTKTLSITHPEGTSTITVSSYDQSGQLIAAANTEQTYTITATVGDDFTTETRTLHLSTAGVTLDIFHNGKGLGIGKVCQTQNQVEINSTWRLVCDLMTFAGADLGTTLAGFLAASDVGVHIMTGKIGEGTSSSNGSLYGSALILTIGSKALIFFDITFAENQAGSVFTWGISSALIETATGLSITPIDGGFYIPPNRVSTEYGRIFTKQSSGTQHFWNPGYISTTSGTITKCYPTTFSRNQHMTGVCYGTIET